MIFHNDDDVDDDLHIITANPTYNNYKGLIVLISIYHAKDIFNYFNKMASIFIFLLLKRYFKSHFSNIKCPIFNRDYSTINFYSSTKGVVDHWSEQVICRNKSFFGTDYGMATQNLVLIDTSTFLYEHAHGGYSAYKVPFGTIYEIIQLMHYTLWYPI